MPAGLLERFRYSNSLLGLGGNVDCLARNSRDLTVHTGSPVTSIRSADAGGYRIENAAGISEHVDVLYFATPPYVTRSLLRHLAALNDAAEILDRFAFFPADLAIHRDPVYMPARL